VGERQSSAAITTQYANADPIYRVKTAALPAKYAYYRTCRGDGHCGWRGESHRRFRIMFAAANCSASHRLHLL
jgi:ubiquitin thioesterase protein OTUB1